MKIRRMAKITVSGQLIAQALAFPDDAAIYNIVQLDYSPDTFVFYVEHEEFPIIPEGGAT